MPLPPDFHFSQGNLQDYSDCPRRFQLRYLLELAWPAVEAEPADEFETRIRDGEAFHRMVQQHVLGVLPATLRRSRGAIWRPGGTTIWPRRRPICRPTATRRSPFPRRWASIG